MSLKPLAHQVAGHPSSVLTSEDGQYIVKPSLEREIEFYAQTAPKYFAGLVEGGYIPKYFGIQDHDALPSKGPKVQHAIKLENLTHGYVKPNILDVKLGTQLFDPLDERLTPEKQARMEGESRNTTSGPNGIRLTGFAVYNSATDVYVSTPKEYGKSIPSSELPHGIRRFFPCSTEDATIHTHSDLTPAPPLGSSPSRLVQAITEILEKVQAIQALAKDYEWRAYGSSLLIVYEGDEAEPLRTTVKHIDFAHARYTEGQGPDEGMLKGFDTIVALLEGRLTELNAL